MNLETLRKNWPLAAIIALPLVMLLGPGILSAMSKGGPRIDPLERDLAAGHLCWCAATTSAEASPGPVPDVKPDTGDTVRCRNCKGRGEVGDGRTMVTCTICNGTGRVPANAQPEVNETGDAGSLPDGFGPSTGKSQTFPSPSVDPDEESAAGDSYCSDGSCSSGGGRRGLFGGFFRRR